jgi:selenium-binding protein 1
LYAWDEDKLSLTHKWTIDFYKEKLGRAHQMRFGAYSLYSSKNQNKGKDITLLDK